MTLEEPLAHKIEAQLLLRDVQKEIILMEEGLEE